MGNPFPCMYIYILKHKEFPCEVGKCWLERYKGVFKNTRGKAHYSLPALKRRHSDGIPLTSHNKTTSFWYQKKRKEKRKGRQISNQLRVYGNVTSPSIFPRNKQLSKHHIPYPYREKATQANTDRELWEFSRKILLFVPGPPNSTMKALFKTKPRTPAYLVRQTRDLLIYLSGCSDRDTKRELKVRSNLWLVWSSILVWDWTIVEWCVFEHISVVKFVWFIWKRISLEMILIIVLEFMSFFSHFLRFLRKEENFESYKMYLGWQIDQTWCHCNKIWVWSSSTRNGHWLSFLVMWSVELGLIELCKHKSWMLL